MSTMTLTVEDGIATLPDGTTIDLLNIQAACNSAFQELGDMEYGEAASALSQITQKWQGPHGDWFEGTYDDPLEEGEEPTPFIRNKSTTPSP